MRDEVEEQHKNRNSKVTTEGKDDHELKCKSNPDMSFLARVRKGVAYESLGSSRTRDDEIP